MSWFLFVEPDLTWRIYAINFALGGMSLLVAAELRAVPRKRLIDWVILAASLLSGLNFFVRTLVVVHAYGAVEPYSADHGSIYWTTVILSHAVLSIVNASPLVTGTTLEVIAELQRKSETDPLSGLLNRRGFEEQASGLLADNDRKAIAGSLVLCDLDHFKAVNDSLGHISGDRVIAAFADMLRKRGGRALRRGPHRRRGIRGHASRRDRGRRPAFRRRRTQRLLALASTGFRTSAASPRASASPNWLPAKASTPSVARRCRALRSQERRPRLRAHRRHDAGRAALRLGRLSGRYSPPRRAPAEPRRPAGRTCSCGP